MVIRSHFRAFATLAILSSSITQAATLPQQVHSFFITPDQPSPLTWKTQASGPVRYTVTDTWGKNILSSVATASDGKLALNVTLPAGYYDITLTDSKETFGIVAIPAFEGTPDPYFSMDSALSGLVPSTDLRVGIIAGYKRNGIAMSRERLEWSEVNPAQDEWKFNARSRYDELDGQYKQAGVPILQIYQSMPEYVGKYPLDLVKTADAWTTILKHSQSQWAALEAWNEPDISLDGNLPTEHMIPLLHTLAYVCQENRFPIQLGSGVFAMLNEDYMVNSAENGMLQNSDFFTFHTYTRATESENLMTHVRNWMTTYGQTSKPVWLTESGWPWRRGTERPEMQQDAESAQEINAKAIEFRACGATRYFPFVAPYYEENANNFAMIGKDGTPLRSLSGYVTAIRLLAHQPYLGDVILSDQAVRRARVFGGQDRVVVALYTTKVASDATITCNIPAKEVLGIDGRRLARPDAGKVPVPDGLTYLITDRASLGPLLKTNTSAMKLYRLAQQPAPARQHVPAVIPQFVAKDNTAAQISPECYMITIPPETRANFPFNVRLTNLDATKTITLKVAPSAGGRPLAAPVTITLPPRSVGRAEWTADLRPAFKGTDHALIKIDAEEKGAMQPLLLPVATEKTLDEWRSSSGRMQRLPLTQLNRWSANATEGSKAQFISPETEIWRYEITFPQNAGRWAYPWFTLPDEINMNGASGLLLRIRREKGTSVRFFAWEPNNVAYLTSGILIGPQWRTVYIPFNRFWASPFQDSDPNGQLDLNQVRRLSIGFSGSELVDSLEVSDCFVVWPKR